MTTLIVGVVGIVGITETPSLIGYAQLAPAVESIGCIHYTSLPVMLGHCGVSLTSDRLVNV